jgi:uncharacterized membrane protein YecN with MAPEG domain
MTLTEKQGGVLKGIVLGAITAFTIVIVGAWLNPFSFDQALTEIDRIVISIKSAMLPALFLAISVGRVAKHRFFTPEDIDGGGLSRGTEKAIILQSLLQNTLEQFCIALVVYLAWALIMPAAWMSVVPLAAITFGLGRIMFFAGYKNGAPSRAIGFALSFYPSIIMLVCIIGNIAWQRIS